MIDDLAFEDWPAATLAGLHQAAVRFRLRKIKIERFMTTLYLIEYGREASGAPYTHPLCLFRRRLT